MGDRGPMTCYKCQEEGHMSRECPNSGGGGGDRGPMTCYKCQEEGHMSRDCPTAGGDGDRPKGCFNCKSEDHMSRDCPEEPRKRSCFNCGAEDHMSRECPEEPKKKGCFNCGEEGHMKSECTQEVLGPDGKPRPPLYTPEQLTEEQLFDDGVSSGINFSKYDSIPVNVSGNGTIPGRLEVFEDAGLRDILNDNIRKANYTVPTPIQRYCIPTIMAGRDMMGCAQTGSGKTAAFLLPILHKLLETGDCGGYENGVVEPGACIMAPTRELAIQIHNEARKFARSSVLRVVVIYGGTSVRSALQDLERGCAVLVATPGRLLDFVNRGKISFASIKFFVLDEADRMLDMGFQNDIKTVMTHATMPALTNRQTLMFSATFPETVQVLASSYLNDYVYYVIGIVGGANTDVKQELIPVDGKKKNSILIEKLKDISQNDKNKIIVFVETKRTADYLASYLSQQELNSTSIHGDRFQSQREQALAEFKKGIRNILLATSVAARGLDIKGVTHVINYDLPKDVDEYVHRIGRTGRVGNTGHALSFFDESKDSDKGIAKNLTRILAESQQEVPDWLQSVADNSGFSSEYGGVGDFGAADIRGGVDSAAFGGPAADDDGDEW